MKWRAIYLATRNLFIAVGMIAIGVWFPNQDWNLGIISAVLVAFIWWMFYRIACSTKEVISEKRFHRVHRERIRKPGKRAVASWARLVRDIEEEKEEKRAGLWN